jgi:hypothetical protein
MYSTTPVWDEQSVEHEKVMALDQPEYVPVMRKALIWW